LVKTEPDDYSYASLESEGRVVWDGVANPLARIHLRAMREGDLVLVYHTGSEKAVTGLARVARAAHPDPSASGKSASGAVAVDLAAVRRAPAPVTLATIRATPACRDLALVRMPRLSVMPVDARAWTAITRLAQLPGG
jgi:predicted RNA-binding protein with PUA-like domain